MIKRIEIRNFRSIHHLIIDESLNDLNIFVGNNDIGKSNILKALNLFFNDQTDIGEPLEFWEDFNKNIERTSGKGQYIKIVIDIDLKYETDKYVRWTKKWNNKGELEESKDVYENNGSPSDFIKRSRAPGWLDRICFRYVPAIKSQEYFQHLYEELHDVLNSTYAAKFEENTESLINSIQEITNDITVELKESLGLEHKISLPSDVRKFFGSLDFSLELENKKFHLSNRGDGIKTRHIPVVLKFIADNAKKVKRGALDVQTYWGFEEPENNLEMSHSFEVAKSFLEYSAGIQIFLTTHSPAFYSLHKESNRSSTWVVDRDNENSTTVFDIKNTSIDVDEKMGVLSYITPFIKSANEELLREKEEKKKLEEKIEELNPNSRVLVFTEDSNNDLSMIRSFMEANGFQNDITLYLSYEGKSNLKNAIYTSKWLISEKYQSVEQVIFHRDKDVDGEELREHLNPKLPNNFHLFITKGYDLDSHFINKEHIESLYPELADVDLDNLIEEAIVEVKEKSLKKISDGLYQQKFQSGSLVKHEGPSKFQNKANELYENEREKFFYGKTALGVLKGKLQNHVNDNPIDFFKPTEHLKIDELTAIAENLA